MDDENDLLGVLGVMMAAVLWGTTGVAATFAPEVGAVAIGSAAMGVGGLLQAGLAFRTVTRHHMALRVQWHWLLAGAVSVAVYPLAFYASMRLAGVTVGTVVSLGSAPLASALIEILLDGLRVSRRWVVGAALGLIGMALLSLAEGYDEGMNDEPTSLMAGVALGLTAGLTYAFYSWVARRMMQRRIPTRAAMGTMFGLGGLMLMPVLFVTGGSFLDSWQNASVGLYMAFVPMFVGYLCFGYGLARVQASTATTITLLEPVVAAGLAALIVGERLPVQGWIGVGLIFACLLCITLPKR
ncbi:MAG: EamA family transporter [Lautropia sp.]|nr:EamA family transporter [Lautropia sp.]